MSGPTPNDWPIRLPLALIRGAVPIVGVMHYYWPAHYVGFYFWIELVMLGLFFSVVTLREWWRDRVPQFALKVPIVLVVWQVPAIITGVCLTLDLKGVPARFAYLLELLHDPSLRASALIQAGVTVASGFAWNYQHRDSEAKLDLMGRTSGSRLATTLAAGGIGLAAVAVYCAANDVGDFRTGRLYALVSAWVVGITWAASDAFPQQFNRFTDWWVQSRKPRKDRYDTP